MSGPDGDGVADGELGDGGELVAGLELTGADLLAQRLRDVSSSVTSPAGP
jgi:hypothetical protein